MAFITATLKKMKSKLWLLLFLYSGFVVAENHVIFLDITHTKNSIRVKPQLDFHTSPQIKEAIDNGIRINIIAKTSLFEPQNLWFDKSIKQQKLTLEVSYFSLGKHYKIKNLKTDEQIGVNDYPQLWKEIENLMVFEFPKTLVTSNSWIKLRIMLDKGALPIAMQLPVLFDSNWDINTPWHKQKVKQQ